MHMLFPFLACALTCALASGVVVLHYQNRGEIIPLQWILLTAIMFRCIAVIGDPFLEDDYFRYLWDGLLTATTHDPYTSPPSAYFEEDWVSPQFQRILSQINYPDIATVYGPVAQWIFAAGYLISPGETWPLQLFCASADIGILLLLWHLRHNNFLLLYAWSPLLMKEFAFAAHPDVIGVLCMLLGWWFSSNKRSAASGILLGLAVGIKVFAILIVPFCIVATRDKLRAGILLCCFAVTILMISLTFGTIQIWYPAGLDAMARSWLFNAPIYLGLHGLVPLWILKSVGLMLYCLLSCRMLWIHWIQQPHVPMENLRGDWLFGAFLLALPVVNPWYAVWFLPFAVLMPTRWAWVASVALLFSYLSGAYIDFNDSRSYQIPWTVIILEYGLIFIAAWFDQRRPLCQLTTYMHQQSATR